MSWELHGLCSDIADINDLTLQ